MTKIKIADCIAELAGDLRKVRFVRILKICELFFGSYRVSGSHHIFKTPWQGDPRINLQKGKGSTAKPYQVNQVINALQKLKEFEEDSTNEQNH